MAIVTRDGGRGSCRAGSDGSAGASPSQFGSITADAPAPSPNKALPVSRRRDACLPHKIQIGDVFALVVKAKIRRLPERRLNRKPRAMQRIEVVPKVLRRHVKVLGDALPQPRQLLPLQIINNQLPIPRPHRFPIHIPLIDSAPAPAHRTNHIPPAPSTDPSPSADAGRPKILHLQLVPIEHLVQAIPDSFSPRMIV